MSTRPTRTRTRRVLPGAATEEQVEDLVLSASDPDTDSDSDSDASDASDASDIESDSDLEPEAEEDAAEEIKDAARVELDEEPDDLIISSRSGAAGNSGPRRTETSEYKAHKEAKHQLRTSQQRLFVSELQLQGITRHRDTTTGGGNGRELLDTRNGLNVFRWYAFKKRAEFMVADLTASGDTNIFPEPIRLGPSLNCLGRCASTIHRQRIDERLLMHLRDGKCVLAYLSYDVASSHRRHAVLVLFSLCKRAAKGGEPAGVRDNGTYCVFDPNHGFHPWANSLNWRQIVLYCSKPRFNLRFTYTEWSRGAQAHNISPQRLSDGFNSRVYAPFGATPSSKLKGNCAVWTLALLHMLRSTELTKQTATNLLRKRLKALLDAHPEDVELKGYERRYRGEEGQLVGVADETIHRRSIWFFGIACVRAHLGAKFAAHIKPEIDALRARVVAAGGGCLPLVPRLMTELRKIFRFGGALAGKISHLTPMHQLFNKTHGDVLYRYDAVAGYLGQGGVSTILMQYLGDDPVELLAEEFTPNKHGFGSNVNPYLWFQSKMRELQTPAFFSDNRTGRAYITSKMSERFTRVCDSGLLPILEAFKRNCEVAHLEHLCRLERVWPSVLVVLRSKLRKQVMPRISAYADRQRQQELEARRNAAAAEHGFSLLAHEEAAEQKTLAKRAAKRKRAEIDSKREAKRARIDAGEFWEVMEEEGLSTDEEEGDE